MATTRAKKKTGRDSPVMRQYLDIKREHEDAILFFRLGDFYEMFFEDAERAAGVLDIALTSRNRKDPDPIPMCGVPYHSSRAYIAKLLDAGLRVALCEQVELPGAGSRIARRAVTRVVTPGTNLDEESLSSDRSNFLVGLCVEGASWGLAVTDFSTGEVRATEGTDRETLEEELAALAPSELVLGPGSEDEAAAVRELLPGCMVSEPTGKPVVPYDPGPPAENSSAVTGGTGAVSEAAPFEAAPFEAPATELPPLAASARDVLLDYLARTQGDAAAHLRPAMLYDTGRYLRLDAATRRNLELVEASGGGRKGSLLSVLDRCVTAMGRRLLRQWILSPMADLATIGGRLDSVERLVEDFELREDLRGQLREVGDLERLGGRLGARSAGPRDIVQLAGALGGVGRVMERLSRASGEPGGLPGALNEAASGLDALPQAAEGIRATLVEDPPALISKGGVIRDGFHEEVDRLRSVRSDGKGWIASFEAEERERTGIPGLKIGFNRVFGYFIEISHANQHLVPEDYVRKQTLANAERYITDALKRREAEVLGAEERLGSLESALFGELLTELGGHQAALGGTAAAVAVIDALAGLAETAHGQGYVRPEFHDGYTLEIRGGRHPVVEVNAPARFVPNDCTLGPESRLVMVVTGPNMAGKSTFLRQTALIALMAHCGCFVPADAARVPRMDRIFTRIGASDNLSAGQSTFMVEMSETANILCNMTDRSLVVLDEIGRGTSTFDGISIAWAVAEAMVRARVKTVFATHYHELAGLEGEHAMVENFSVAVERYKEDVVFLYRVVAGPTSGSYGIEVARLAGVPDGVITKAREILARFESGEGLPGMTGNAQLSLFAPRPQQDEAAAVSPQDQASAGLARRLSDIDVETLTPLEALNALASLVAEARKTQ